MLHLAEWRTAVIRRSKESENGVAFLLCVYFFFCLSVAISHDTTATALFESGLTGVKRVLWRVAGQKCDGRSVNGIFHEK